MKTLYPPTNNRVTLALDNCLICCLKRISLNSLSKRDLRRSEIIGDQTLHFVCRSLVNSVAVSALKWPTSNERPQKMRPKSPRPQPLFEFYVRKTLCLCVRDDDEGNRSLYDDSKIVLRSKDREKKIPKPSQHITTPVCRSRITHK